MKETLGQPAPGAGQPPVLSYQDFAVFRADEGMAYEVAELNSTVWQHTYRGLIDDAILEAATAEARAPRVAEMIRTGGAEYYLFQVAGKSAGMAALCPCRDEDAGDTDGEISAIYFLPEFWGKGYAQQAMAYCLGRLRALGYETLTIWVLRDNLRARFYYEKMGMRADREEPLELVGGVQGMRYRMAIPVEEE